MIADARLLGIVIALFIGAGAGWLFASRSLGRQFDQKLRRILDVHRKQHDAVVDKLNASQAMARKELEHQRSTPRHLATVAADQRSAVARLEEKLKLAYVELDRLRLQVNGPAPVGTPKPSHGFADTQPFDARQKAPQR